MLTSPCSCALQPRTPTYPRLLPLCISDFREQLCVSSLIPPQQQRLVCGCLPFPYLPNAYLPQQQRLEHRMQFVTPQVYPFGAGVCSARAGAHFYVSFWGQVVWSIEWCTQSSNRLQSEASDAHVCCYHQPDRRQSGLPTSSLKHSVRVKP